MNRQILEEASTWFIEFRAGPMNSQNHAEFVQWLTRSPEHIRAYLEISGTYTQLPQPGFLSHDTVSELLNRARTRLNDTVTALPELEPIMRTEIRPPPAEQPSRSTEFRGPIQWRVWTLAATILLAIGCVAVWAHAQRGLYTTDAAEQRTVTLQDGSRIELDARSRLRVHYSKGTRNVELYDGQALFQVAKDPTRPFLVHSGEATVRAVGTQFDVFRKAENTTVTVLEGRVAVYAPEMRESSSTTSSAQEGNGTRASRRASSSSTGSSAASPTGVAANSTLDPFGSAAIFLSAGEQATVTPQAIVWPHRANLSVTTAWTRGELEFEETPLPQVAEEFNRYSPRRLILDSSGLESVRISGVYSSSDPEALILFLRSQPDLIVSESGSEIHIRTK